MDIPKISQVALLVADGNHAQVELYGRIILRKLPENAHAFLAIAWAAMHTGLDDHACKNYQSALKIATSIRQLQSDLDMPSEDLARLDNLNAGDPVGEKSETGQSGGHLLIRAWGYGFWSEVLHVLGGLMLAEISGREPVVHWGADSLYHRTDGDNAFEDYFEPVGSDVSGLIDSEFDYFPPKWNRDNLFVANVDKKNGVWSKMSGLHLLPRRERVVVMDYYAGVLNLLPYVATDSAMNGMNIDEIYRYLFGKYLTIKSEIVAIANQFIDKNLSDDAFLAVHVRGSDKAGEFIQVEKFHTEYLSHIAKKLKELPDGCKIFLMTDDTRILDRYRAEYGDRIVVTDCLRTSTTVGTHYQVGDKNTQAGREVIVDTLIASRATKFVGNGYSNPSIFVYLSGHWADGDVTLIGGNLTHRYNTHLYKTISVI